VDKDEQKSDWSGKLTETQLRYAAWDAELPLRLYPVLAAKLTEAKLTATADLENRVLPCVVWMGTSGVMVDRRAWQLLALEAQGEALQLAGELDALAPTPSGLFGSEPRNWNSPAQVKDAFAAIGITPESTNDNALAAIDHPLAELLRRYRGAAKLCGTYGDKWLRHVTPDDRVYPGWHQAFTVTGRMSSSGPNMQQLPRDQRYRRCFVAPPGRVLVKADYSQIELRIAAVVASDSTMMGTYRAGGDIHALTAASVLKKPLAEVTKADRQLAKAVNFGLVFGGGAAMLVGYAKSSYGVTMTETQAQAYRAAFFARYPGLKRWHNSQSKDPVATRTRGGRRRKNVASFTEKLNSVVQGTAADGMKAALALLWERRQEHPTACPVLAVHDEIVIESDERDAEAVKLWLVRAMTDGMAPLCDPVPVEVETTIAPTWGG
jgi:DNA polymerase-1